MRELFSILFILLAFNFINSQAISEGKLQRDLEGIKTEKNVDEKKIIALKNIYEKAKSNNYSIMFSTASELARLYTNLGKNKEVIEITTDVEKYINSKTPEEDLSKIYRMRGLAYGQLGFLEESYQSFQISKKHTKNIRDKDLQHYLSSLLYENFTSYFDRSKKQSDSIKFYLTKSLEEAELISDKSKSVSNLLKYDMITSLQNNLGIYYMFIDDPKDPTKAEKYFKKALQNSAQKEILPYNKLNLYMTVSNYYLEIKNYDLAIEYGKNALDLEKNNSSPYNRENIYEIISEAYLAKNNSREAKRYTELFKNLKDSIRIAEKHSVDKISSQIVKKTETDITEKQKTSTGYILIIAIICTLFISLTVWYYWKRKNKIEQKRFKAIIKRLINKTADKTSTSKVSTKENDIVQVSKKENGAAANASLNKSNDVAELLEAKLQKFEDREDYLKKDMSITWLANNFKSNPKYVSEAIRELKKSNFSTYINQLRIQYIIDKLYNEPFYMEYKISYLAEDCGFSHSQVFVIAFKKETGLTPSSFIEKLRIEKNEMASQ
ncbi:helix-turn-helix domain-containing protein [Frigoriflavimonas asaccharolytica]|uniref:AraC-like DNA-binding protein n=1 Tax=Frigoriflavimonas asaccharolytica TaxID=2735899 RepID=A0A8J8G9N9_9FLAO|nr:AraC family transcriptional regulator [Frigoriflavimonas asaccharolytica]NRS94048.1 AraC-like DNA-binding protein [Frigoriflavimonas asaccharolytica]